MIDTVVAAVVLLVIVFGLLTPLSILVWAEAVERMGEWKAERAVRRMQKEAAKSAAWRDAR